MRVHVVVDRPGSDRILPRKARYLGAHNQWTLGEQPSDNVDCNLYMNYLMWDRFREWTGTLQAAYFTHRDEWNQQKAQIWDDCAEAMDLRVTTAKRNLQYLEKYGPTAIARPPVEHDIFTIAKAPKRKDGKPIVGVAGYTYNDGRKGEDLISALAASKIGKKLDLRAAGRGWPITTIYYDWPELPKFFQGLDVLVVPSQFEGVPMPPIEALACGVKVVIPRDVGICDELPDVPGIYRFDKGDEESFIAATEEAAFSDPVDRDTLRDVTCEFTPENWAWDHAVALEEMAYGAEGVEAISLEEGNAGVYLVAFGEPSRECAVRAIGALHEHMPWLPVAAASTEPIGGEDIFIQREDIDIGGRIAKLAAYDAAPEEWQCVLYMDADTEIVGDVSFLLEALADGWELVICRDMSKYCTVDMMKRPDNHDECRETWGVIGTMDAYQYNGGVLGFRRCERTENFFRMWNEEWQKYGKRDQGALLRALYRQPLRLLLLHNQWNATDRYEMPNGPIMVVHHNTEARRWAGLIHGRTDSELAWDAVKYWEGLHPEKRPKI